jgi:hypothetical protein
VEHKQTSDRLHVLAKDTDGAISLWDVVKCERVKVWDAGSDDLFAEVLKKSTRASLFRRGSPWIQEPDPSPCR